MPTTINEISVFELKSLKDEGTDVLLIDVRTKEEWDKSNIPFAKLLWDMKEEEILALRKDQTIVFHCHFGSRSKRMTQVWQEKGFSNVHNLIGGIDAWSIYIDSCIPRY